MTVSPDQCYQTEKWGFEFSLRCILNCLQIDIMILQSNLPDHSAYFLSLTSSLIRTATLQLSVLCQVVAGLPSIIPSIILEYIGARMKKSQVRNEQHKFLAPVLVLTLTPGAEALEVVTDEKRPRSVATLPPQFYLISICHLNRPLSYASSSLEEFQSNFCAMALPVHFWSSCLQSCIVQEMRPDAIK